MGSRGHLSNRAGSLVLSAPRRTDYNREVAIATAYTTEKEARDAAERLRPLEGCLLVAVRAPSRTATVWKVRATFRDDANWLPEGLRRM